MTGIVTDNHSIDYAGNVYCPGDTIMLPVGWFATMLKAGYIYTGLRAGALNILPPTFAGTALS